MGADAIYARNVEISRGPKTPDGENPSAGAHFQSRAAIIPYATCVANAPTQPTANPLRSANRLGPRRRRRTMRGRRRRALFNGRFRMQPGRLPRLNRRLVVQERLEYSGEE